MSERSERSFYRIVGDLIAGTLLCIIGVLGGLAVHDTKVEASPRGRPYWMHTF